jgi:hypothetical protein
MAEKAVSERSAQTEQVADALTQEADEVAQTGRSEDRHDHRTKPRNRKCHQRPETNLPTDKT